ncbi:MAG: hypothetical protein PHC66_04785 [Candidatus Nanoarchaeia archaeon]|nr:hypothetical protein [Candidatus Nanoarchaeia archaeon]MDD5238982.1 hypothetical protein [Candidatus Nanoarchaeia archaeon]
MDDNQKSRLEKHLNAANITIVPEVLDGLLKLLDTEETVPESDIQFFFANNGINPVDKDMTPYFDAAFIAAYMHDSGNIMFNVYDSERETLRYYSEDALRYCIQCEIKANLTKDPEYSIRGRTIGGIATIKKLAKMVTDKTFFEKIECDLRAELGITKVAQPNSKKKTRAKLPKPVAQPVIAAPASENEFLPYETSPEQTPVYKFVPSEPSKKRRCKPAVSFDERLLRSEIKKSITSNENAKEIIAYLRGRMDCKEAKAVEFFNKTVYNTIKDALWTDQYAARNTIDYLTEELQAELAGEYVNKNITPESYHRGIRQVRELLNRHLSLDEDNIEKIVSAQVESILRIEEPTKKRAPKTKEDIDYDKQIYATMHVKERALERIGEDADIDWVLQDMFHSGKTIYTQYDIHPHRLFMFSGDMHEIVYEETDQEYILITVFPHEDYKNGVQK